jgi:nitrogenase molybdenum-cofactor synthesis protein NifE
MLIEKTRVSIVELKEGKGFPFAPLEGVGPNLWGWGVVETCLLLPNSVCLMAGPLACLRHSAFMAQARGFYKRFYMLPIEEVELVMGSQVGKIKKAIEYIISKEKPEIFLLAGTCCEYVLGVEYKKLIKEIKEKYGIEVIYLIMAPLNLPNRPSPFDIAYTALYEILKNAKNTTDKKAINVLGTYLPLSEDSELYNVLRAAGFEKIYQIQTCKGLEELKNMANSGLNLVIHFRANLLAKKLEKIGMPYIFCPVCYDPEEVIKQYQRLEEVLGKKLNYEELQITIPSEVLKLIEGKKVAVGCSVVGSPYELARALTKFGAKVVAIFDRHPPKPFEKDYINFLSENSPETFVYNISHPYLNECIEAFDEVEVAFGVDTGIYCRKAINIPLHSYQAQPFGFSATKWLFEEIEKNFRKPISNYDWIYKYNLLI